MPLPADNAIFFRTQMAKNTIKRRVHLRLAPQEVMEKLTGARPGQLPPGPRLRMVDLWAGRRPAAASPRARTQVSHA